VVGLDSGHSDCDPECRTLAARVRHSQGRVPLMDVPLPRKARIMTDPSKEVRSTYLLVTGVNSGDANIGSLCAVASPTLHIVPLSKSCVWGAIPAHAFT